MSKRSSTAVRSDDSVEAEVSSSVTVRRSEGRIPSIVDPAEVTGVDDTEPNAPPSDREPLAERQLPAPVEAHLEIVRGSTPHRVQRLKTVRSSIGRGPEADVVVNDSRASRRHASIFYTGNEFRIRDESSVNGTLLNGSRVVEYGLRDGDEIVVADTTLRFRCRLS